MRGRGHRWRYAEDVSSGAEEGRDGVKHDAAIERATLSRETLYKYRQLPDRTGDEPEWLLKQIHEELSILAATAAEAPELAPSIDLLVEAWQDFAQQLKRKAH